MGYKKDVIKGFSWLAAFRVITRALSFVRTAIIARLLTPSQVGVFAIATIVLSLMEIVTETGINIFLTQKKDDIDRYISTAWVTSIARGIIISVVIFISAPFVAAFFNVSEVVDILRLVSLVPLIRAFINPSVVKFLKDLTFHKEFTYRLIIFMVETFVTLLLVYLDPSPINLVWGLIFGAAFEVVLSFYMATPLPGFVFEKTLLREVFGRGKWLTLTGIFNYLYHSGDDLVVGKLLGTASLGMYDMAYKISMLPITEGSDVIGKVMFPVLVKMSHDKKRLMNAYLKSVAMISALVIPMCAVFIFFPEPIIRVILGEQWLDVAPVLRVLAIFGGLRAISISVISPIYALDKQEYVTTITLVSLTGMALTIIPFIQRWGLIGAAFAALFGTLLSLPVIIYYVLKLFKDVKS
jgi:O-antigen/teichoic acid export membrane protein